MADGKPKPPPGIGPKYIEIEIDEQGEVRIEAHGYKGEGCRAATKSAEEALGEVRHRTVKRGEHQGLQQRVG